MLNIFRNFKRALNLSTINKVRKDVLYNVANKIANGILKLSQE
jgi:hypothetical protein